MSVEFLEMENIDIDTIIGHKPWALALHKESLNLCSKIFLNGVRVIEDIDSREEFNKKHIEAFAQCLQTKMNDATCHLGTMYQHHLDKVGALLDKVVLLENKLGITPSVAEKDFTTEPLVELEATLKSTVDEYQKKLDEQGSILAELQKKHAFYAYKLGKSPKRLSMIQKKTAIEEFRSQIEKLEEEYISRQQRYDKIKRNIEIIDKETEIVPKEKWAEFCDDSSPLNDEMIIKIEDFYKAIICLRSKLYEKIDELNKQLEKLWIQLEVSEEEQKQFLNTVDGYSKTSQQKFESEIEKLMEMREKQLPEIIEKQKNLINYWWDRCHCDSSTKNAFPLIYSTDYSEELYRNYDDEIIKWEQYYQKHKAILEPLDEYKKLQNSLSEINLNMDGVKFYENRGGVLLSVIKKKNILISRLTSAENKLLILSKDYLKNNNRPFFTFGMTIENFIVKQKKSQGVSQNTHQDKLKLTVPAKSQSLMKTPQRKFSKNQAFKNPSSESRVSKTKSKTKTPTLPKFKLNQSTTKSSPSTSQWKPSKIVKPKQSDGDDSSWTDYSDFEKDVKKYSSRSTSIKGE